jgi:hypothetical protein
MRSEAIMDELPGALTHRGFLAAGGAPSVKRDRAPSASLVAPSRVSPGCASSARRAKAPHGLRTLCLLGAALGAIVGSPAAASAGAMLWSAPIALDPGGSLWGVACPSISQCTAVDQSGKQVTFNPTAPGTPTPTTIDGSQELTGVACPSASQCTAVDGIGREVTFNPTAPGTPTPTPTGIGNRLDGVACPSTSRCTAVGGGDEVTFNPTAPGTPTPTTIDSGNRLDGVACPSASQCTAVGGDPYDHGGHEVTFDPTAPGTPTRYFLYEAYPLSGVACPSTSQCTAVSLVAMTFNPTAPLASLTLEPIATPYALIAIDCSSITQCVTVGGGNGFVGTPGHTLAVSVTGGGTGKVTGTGISCPGTCSHSYASGTMVTLTAIPASGSAFSGWSGGGCSGTGSCTVTMSSDQSVIATFTVTGGPSGGGGSGGGTSGGSASSGQSSGSGSVLGFTTASISTAQIAALLGQQLIPSGKAAKIAAMLKAGGFTRAFNALEAGRAVIDWYQVPPGAKLAKKAKPILVAAGQMTFSAAGTAKIKVKLTAAGKRLLKQAKSLKLTAKGIFTPTGKAPVVTTKVFVLKP